MAKQHNSVQCEDKNAAHEQNRIMKILLFHPLIDYSNLLFRKSKNDRQDLLGAAGTGQFREKS